MKKMTKKERSAFYLKMAKLEYKKIEESVSFVMKKYHNGDVFYKVFPELKLITDYYYSASISRKQMSRVRSFGYLLAHEMAK